MLMLPANIPFAHKDDHIETLNPEFGKSFEAEVEAGNFLRGGTSLLLVGKDAEHSARQWAACLHRGGYHVYRLTVLEAVRRMEVKPIFGDNEDRKAEFDEAECILMDDFFSETVMSDEMVYLFVWFFRELTRAGVVLILASDNLTPELETYGPIVGDIIENTFEVIHGKSSRPSKAKKKTGAKGNERIG